MYFNKNIINSIISVKFIAKLKLQDKTIKIYNLL